MIALRRPALSLVAFAALLSVPTTAQVQDTFNEGIDLLSRGQDEEALAAFQRVLAQDPSHAEAYELWQITEHEIWLKLLTMEGDYELVAKRLIELAGMGRTERSNDLDAIRALVAELHTEDIAARMQATRRLAAEHGEYAVAVMVHALADQGNADKRVVTMQALTQMSNDVVIPLIAALESSDGFHRRNVALTLGYIGDPRANAALAALAASDSEQSVRTAATEALGRCGGTADAAAQFLDMGDAYYVEADAVLMPHQVSDVVWDWNENNLVATNIPRFLYAPEMARRAYYSGLMIDPTSTRALAGLARCAMTEKGRLDQWIALGQDGGEWSTRLEADVLAAQLAGAPALDLALGWALDQNDQIAASGLCQVLALTATAPTANLQRALSTGMSGAVRGEAAVALGSLAVRGGSGAQAETVSALTEAATREILKVAFIIDADAERRGGFARALAGRGVYVNEWESGARGLAALRAVPGVDVVLIADRLPDLTVYQIVDEIRRDPRLVETPVLVIPSAGEVDDSLYGEKVTGVVASVAEMEALDQVLEASVNPDRVLANQLAVRAASTLEHLGSSGTDLSLSADALAGALSNASDDVVGSALGALGAAGGAAHVMPITAVLADAERSENIRLQAAEALGAIFARTGSSDGATVDALRAVATSDGSFALRIATARALGRLNLSQEMRAELIRGVYSK